MAQRVHESIEVHAPTEDVFRYWSNFENPSKFMHNVEEVRMTDQNFARIVERGELGSPQSQTPSR
jgi:uncharacterized membrane protein